MLSICATTRMMGRRPTPSPAAAIAAAAGAGAGRGSGGIAAHTLKPPSGLQLPAARHALLLLASPAAMVSFRRAWYCCCLGLCTWAGAGPAVCHPPLAALAKHTNSHPPGCASSQLTHPLRVVRSPARCVGRHAGRQQEGGRWQPGEGRGECVGPPCRCIPHIVALRIGCVLSTGEGAQRGVAARGLCAARHSTQCP